VLLLLLPLRSDAVAHGIQAESIYQRGNLCYWSCCLSDHVVFHLRLIKINVSFQDHRVHFDHHFVT
jgi:hypothetical protein